ncbi:S1C family serine protease [Isoptericola aurantiacus]|uniref:S1C family serine protease n=1 Tax=Isoptericola aurantiacus TaxID=3377839 RepID=UPI00383B574F
MSTDNNPAPQQPPSDPQHPVEHPTAPLPTEARQPAPGPSSQTPPQQPSAERPQEPPRQDVPPASFAQPGMGQQPYQGPHPHGTGSAPAPQHQPYPAYATSGPASYQPTYRPDHPSGYPYQPAEQASGYQPADQAPERTRQRPRWVPMVAVAAGAAVLASGATVGLTSLLDDGTTTSSLAEVGASQDTQAAPVASSTSENPDWQAVTAAVAPSVVAIQVTSQSGGAEGSGVVLDDAGHVLTNNHVVSGAADGTVQVTLSDGRLYEANVIGTDPTTDLAVVELVDPPDDLQPATFGDSDSVQVGDSVLAVGNPLGLANTATTGIVSALDRPVAASGEDGSDVVVTNAIQIDAAVNPGNSGGPLFDAQGRVIGITSSIASLSSGAGQSGSIGLGFAIPVNLGTDVADQLIEDGTAEHAFLGVSLTDTTATADGVTRRGAEVVDVTSGSPAAEAGLQSGDVIVAVDDDVVNGAESLTAYVRERSAGESATITYVRDGQTSSVDVSFAVRDESAQSGSGSQDQQGSGDSGELPWPGQQGDGSDQGQQGQGGSEQDGGSSDSTQPDNIPGWLQELFGN